jgi:UDP-N-acetylmuramate--alanine ligase
MTTIIDIPKHKTIHMIGIGGCGMSAIAKVLLEKGHRVTGSDIKDNITTIRLRDMGATIFLNHQVSNLREADIIVLSSAIKEDNVEYAYALQENMPTYKRAEMLNYLMSHHKKKVAVAGTHGKTTTTAMLTRILDFQQKTPTYVVGGELQDYGGNAALGDNEYFITEADESDGSFLLLNPNIALINNIEPEHMEYYKELSNLLEHFQKFIDSVIAQDGLLIINKDDQELVMLTKNIDQKNIIFYSVKEQSPIMAQNITYSPEGVKFNIILNGEDHGTICMRVHGLHNVYNALAAITYAITERLSLDLTKKGLMDFSGTKRRFQLIGEFAGIQVYDDYGHHPTEIKVTVEGAKKGFDRRTICIFQPHRYTRTRDLIDVFPEAFDEADITIITGIYSANEPKIEGVSGKLIVDKMQERNKTRVMFIEKKSDIAHQILPILKKGDLIITMGAGDIHTVAKEILASLKNQNKTESSMYSEEQ